MARSVVGAVEGSAVPQVRPFRRCAATLLAVLALLPLGSGAAHPASAYVAPVAGDVLVSFQLPTSPWGPGHRGVKLAAREGEAVVAAAGGVVAFAGQVARSRWVSVDHPDGVRTSYGPLGALAVASGQEVVRGQQLGTVAGGWWEGGVALHWSARRDGSYLDPLSLLAGRVRWVPTLVGPGRTQVTDLPTVPSYRRWQGRRLLGVVEPSLVADGPGWLLPPNPNHAVGVAGLNSASHHVPIDLTHLGYAPEDVTYLSYAGRVDDVADPADPRRDQLPYGPEHTWEGVHEGALRLRDQLRALHAQRPGQAVDLVGHSMGGVVVLYYLLVLHDPADPALPPVAHAATIASPLTGADVANAILLASRSPVVDVQLDLLARTSIPTGNHRARAVADLAVGSAVLAELAGAWADAQRDRYASPLATGTQVLTIGAEADVVVPEHRSSLPGSEHVVLPGGHHRVRTTEASRIVLRAFLADEPVPGGPGGLGHALSYPIGWGERLLGWEVYRQSGGLAADAVRAARDLVTPAP